MTETLTTRADIVVLGAGPKAAAIAAKAHVLNELGYGPLRVAVLEQREIAASWTGRHGFTNGSEPLGTRPEKDVGFPYQSTHRWGPGGRDIDRMMLPFSWQSHLMELGEYRRWVDAGTPFPEHRELARYVSWALSLATHGVEVRLAKVTNIALHADGWLLRCHTTNDEQQHVLAEQGLVLTGPGKLRSLPCAARIADRVITPAATTAEIRALNVPPKGRVCIVGSGESAVSLALSLIREFGDALELTFVAPMLPYSRSESFLDNTIYSNPQFVGWSELAEAQRQEFIRRTDRGVMSPAALAQLSRHRKLSFMVGRVRQVKSGEGGSVQVVVDPPEDQGQIREVVEQDFDIVANCTGSCLLTALVELLGESRGIVEERLGLALLDEPAVQRALDSTLALQDLTPRIHMPAMASLLHGPGFANLSCLGKLADHVLSAYVPHPLPEQAPVEISAALKSPSSRSLSKGAKTTNLLGIYSDLAEERPDDPAVIYQREPHVGTVLTWARLAERGEKLHRKLRAAGVPEKGLYAVVLADHPDMLPLLLAVWHLEGAALLVDSQWGERLRASILGHSQPDAFLTIEPELTITLTGGPGSPSVTGDLPRDAALLSYTSGSTGDPKAIVMTHGRLSTTMYAAAAAVVRHRGSAPERIACSMRLSGSGVLNLHYTWALCAEAAVVVLPQLELSTARDYWQRIEEHRIDQTFLVPPLIELLNHVAKPPLGDRPPPICITGSSPLSRRTQDRFQRRFKIGLLNAFGLTESMCACFFGEYDEHGLGRNSIGQPALLRARLRDLEGNLVEGPGDGELELSGPTLFDGYFRNPQATAAAFIGSWFKTGDLLRRDENGSYQTIGRIKDVVMKGSFAVYLNEIEEATVDIGGVHEAAAVPLQLPDGGEDIGLIVRFLPDAASDPSTITSELRDRLGALRTPRRVLETDEALPRTGQEKLDRRRLLEMWQALAGHAPLDLTTVS